MTLPAGPIYTIPGTPSSFKLLPLILLFFLHVRTCEIFYNKKFF